MDRPDMAMTPAERQDSHRAEYKNAQEHCTDGAKVEVNELLFKILPPNCTLEVMDKLACNIMEEVYEIWDAYEINYAELRMKEEQRG